MTWWRFAVLPNEPEGASFSSGSSGRFFDDIGVLGDIVDRAGVGFCGALGGLALVSADYR